MNKKIKTLLFALIMLIGLNTYAQPDIVPYAKSLDMVAKPNFYLNKTVKVRAKFDKFSTLGLDYKPAMRSSENYISFLIQRDDIKDHNIPLSEMKIFIKRKDAEKYIDLNAGDEIEFSGKVFANALGDVWMDADTFTVLTKKSK
ncbi:MAG: hypothetical protein LBK53_01565 [Heliobacteriaceae bacterium]|jgi:hypothetical protein|nr:hypothetical protein [Heliobacteriaceae bacterium]